MKKNILIIGYGNIASRLHAMLCKDSYKIYGMSRTRNRELENHIEWNWLYKDLPNLECNHFVKYKHNVCIINGSLGNIIINRNDVNSKCGA